MSNKKYEIYKSAGKCRRCGDDPLPDKTRCLKCNTAHLLYQQKSKENAAKNGICRYCLINKREQNKSMCGKCLIKHGKKQKDNYNLHRSSCIVAYGGRCKCCGIDNEKYLQLDHIKNDGAAHRLEVFNGTGGSMYTWAFRNSFPNILQLLCANCHQAKTVHGGCGASDHVQLFG